MELVEQKKNIDKEILDEIIQALGQIDYGEVVIKVHNSKVVQIEKKQKKRFN